MIELPVLRTAPLRRDPFRYAEIRHLIPTDRVQALAATIPRDGSFRSSRDSGSDKTYRVINNILFTLEDQAGSPERSLSPAWSELLNDLTGDAYAAAASDVLQIPLGACHREITLKRYRRGDFISTHTDSAAVTATHLLFLNQRWDDAWGGLLCFHDLAGAVRQTFPPLADTSVLFQRSPQSWHSVTTIEADEVERLAVQVVFWNVQERDVAPGRREDRVDA